MGKGVRFTLAVLALTPFVGAGQVFLGDAARIAISITWSMFCTYWIIHYHTKWLESMDKRDRARRELDNLND
jgi:hypothetical protein